MGGSECPWIITAPNQTLLVLYIPSFTIFLYYFTTHLLVTYSPTDTRPTRTLLQNADPLEASLPTRPR